MTQLRVSATQWVEAELDELRALGLERTIVELGGPPGPTAHIDGREYVVLGSNNYLDLAADSRVLSGAADALANYGAGSGASRLVTGSLELHTRLERTLAAWLGYEEALLFSSGYLANIATIDALVARGDEVFSDALNHASIIDGCRLSGATVAVYPHADTDALERMLRRSDARRKLIISDSVFSMEADSAPVGELKSLADEHGAMLMLDESHAIGVLGDTGGGLLEARRLRADVVMGTLSKALGAAGGFIAGSSRLIAYLRHRARGFVFDTAPAPPAIGGALASVEIARSEPERRRRLLELTAHLRDELSGLRLLPGEAAIVPLILGSPERAADVTARLRERGILAPAIRPPSVPDGTSRLRLTVSAGFTSEQVSRAAVAIREAAA